MAAIERFIHLSDFVMSFVHTVLSKCFILVKGEVWLNKPRYSNVIFPIISAEEKRSGCPYGHKGHKGWMYDYLPLSKK